MPHLTYIIWGSQLSWDSERNASFEKPFFSFLKCLFWGSFESDASSRTSWDRGRNALFEIALLGSFNSNASSQTFWGRGRTASFEMSCLAASIFLPQIIQLEAKVEADMPYMKLLGWGSFKYHASISISLILEATSVYVKYPLIIYLNESI